MKTILLIDCYGFFYKAHFAFSNNPLLNTKGEETSVIFAFFNFLQRILKERDSQLAICTLDSKGPTHRHAEDPNYKQNRPPIPSSLLKQIVAIKKILPLLGLPTIEKNGFEADDIIAKYHQDAKTLGYSVEIFSSDKDLFQLVDNNTRIVSINKKTKNYEIFQEKNVEEKFKVKPPNIIDLLALVGDNSDNIPGVAGVGPVTAAKLINTYGSIEKIFLAVDNSSNIPPALQKKLSLGKKNATLAKKLVTLHTSIPNIPTLAQLKESYVDQPALLKEFSHYECSSLIKSFNLNPIDPLNQITARQLLAKNLKKKPPLTPPPNLTPFSRQEIINPTNQNELKPLLLQLQNSSAFTFDLETTSLDPYSANIIAIVFAFDNFKSFFLQLSTQNPIPTNTPPPTNASKKILSLLKPFFENPNIQKNGHNLKFEYSILKIQGISLNGIAHDTMIHEYLMHPDKNRFKLEDLVWDYFQIEKPSYKDIIKNYPNILAIPQNTLKNYTFEDGEFTERIRQIQTQKISPIQKKLLLEIDTPLIQVLADMELQGVLVNTNFLLSLSKQFQKKLLNSQKEIYLLADETFNINSTKQLQKILFQKLALKPIRKTKTGFSTDNFVLERLANKHDIAKILLNYRKYAKLLSTYINALPTLINKITGKIHTNYNQSVTATGRLSSNNPNLQNIPTSDQGQNIRHAFVAPPGFKFVSIDYSQVELRILAFLSKDPLLLKAYQNKQDVHLHTASIIFNKSIQTISESERKLAKTINFSILYGSSPFSLGETLNIPTTQAKTFIDKYFHSYYGVKLYLENILEDARKEKAVATYYGRNRPIHNINSSQFLPRSRAERIAFNTIIQGTASDIIKIAMINIHQKINQGTIKGKMIMQVHDELVFYLPQINLEKNIQLLKYELINVKPFNDILDVSVSIGDCWNK